MAFKILPTDKHFYNSPQAGDPDCLCSRCNNPIPEEDAPVTRCWPDQPGDQGFDPDAKEGTEFRYCNSCLKEMGITFS